MILRGPEGRLRSGWRLALFALAFLAFLLAFNLCAAWLGAPWLTGAWPARWAYLTPLAAAVAASWVMMTRVERRPLAALGLPVDRLAAASFGRGALLGLILIGSSIAVMVLIGAVAWTRAPSTPAGAAGTLLELSAFLVVAALTEELLLRGYPFQVIAEAVGGVAAVGVTAVVFALLHALNPHVSVVGLINILLAGLLLGAAFWRTLSLWFAAGVHFGWNWTMGIAADLPVSGMDGSVPGFSLDTPGIDAVVRGARAVTGGPFGPEGSWLVTGATLAGLLWLATSRRVRPALRVLALRPPAIRRRARRVRPAGGGDDSLEGQ